MTSLDKARAEPSGPVAAPAPPPPATAPWTVRAHPVAIAILVVLTAACGAATALVVVALILADIREWPVLITAAAFELPLLWATVVIAGCTAVAARCHVTATADGVIAAVCVMPSLAQFPRFHTVRIAAADIGAVAHGEHMLWTPWAPEIRQCAWVTTREGARHIIASGRGVGGGSLSVTRAAEGVAAAAGVPATFRTNAPFRMRGPFGGALLTGP